MTTEDSEERTMELTIEALTGTVYDLCVSPYETVLGIKMKVQRLEGIPVYQQQLVWGGVELQDDLCLEEYSIPSGAQLKLLVAMRGGPIHAQRVHLDLEDPTLLEIAELLDSQGGDKYTLMVLRNGDDLDNASFVQVQMLDEEDTMRLSPIQVTEPGQHLSLTASKSMRMEHAVTRDKMKDLMAKFKKRQSPPSLPNQTASSHAPHKGTGKLLILESRAPSRILHSTSSRVTPLSSAHANEAKLSQRKLVFPGDTCSHIHPSGKPRSRITSCSLASRTSRKVRSPSEEAPIISRKTCSRLYEDPSNDVFSPSPSRVDTAGGYQLFDDGGSECPTPSKRINKAELPSKNWQKPPKRKRRTTTNVEPPDGASFTAINNLSRNLSHLELSPPFPPTSDRVPALDTRNRRSEFLPPILNTVPAHPTPKGLSQPLPSLSITTAGKQQNLTVAKKKRCLKCGKKMGLASTYSCRCGGLFCAIHRYAESHSCTFDYKTEGRQLIARSNPVVAAQKLPKI